MDKEESEEEESPQRVVHVHRHQSKPLFEIGGYKITTDTLMYGITGVSFATALALLFNEVNRRKADVQNANTLAEMQERINALMEVPNVEPPLAANNAASVQQQEIPPVESSSLQQNSAADYYDNINQGEMSASSNVNINTIPYMDNVNDIAEAKTRQQEIYNRQRKYYNYNIPSNPWKSQHIVTSQESDIDVNNTLPSAGPQQAPNGIRQAPQQGTRNMFVGRDGVVRKVQPRPEIQVNLA